MSQPDPADTPPRDAGATRTNVDSAWLLAPGHRLAGRYRVIEQVGMGGMGVVYRALDEELGVEVAVKVLRPDLPGQESLVDRFRRELVLARQVTHPHVVRIHDIGKDGDLYFLTMDYVPARSLAAVLSEEGTLDLERALGVVRQLAQALDAAHGRDVVHRDLKPANVLIDAAGAAYITDFGVARSITGSQLTVAGGIVGTPAYLSPEQARGEEVDGRSDLYALGILLFEMLSNALPFPAGTPAEQLAQRLTGRTLTLGELGVEVPQRVEEVIRRCLEPVASRRYQRASELLADLEGDLSVGLSRRPRARRLPWRRLAAAGAGAVIALAVGAALWLAVGRRGVGGGAGAAPAARHSVAVLPLADETGRGELAWVSAGVAELLASALAESPELRVIDPLRVLRMASAVNLARGPLPAAEARQVAELLDADRMVVGRVRSLGREVRLELELLDGEGKTVGSLLAVQGAAESELFALVAALGGRLRERLEVAPLAAPSPAATSSPPAMEAYTRGLDALRQGDAVAAAPALEEAVAADPDFAAAWVRLAGAYEALGFTDKALDAAARATGDLAGAESRLAYEARAREARLKGEPGKAQALYETLLERFPNDVEARIALAEAYAQQGKLETAVATLETVVGQEPNHPRAWYLLAKSLIRSGNTRRAVDDVLVHALVIQNRLGNRQGKAEVLNAMGVAHQELGELEQAATQYAEAARLRLEIGDRRGYATSLRNLATVAMVRGDFAAAEENLTTAIGILREIGDHAGIAHLETAFGALEEERGRYEAALEHYRRSLALRRDMGDELALADSYNNVGYAYYLLGDYDNAQVYWGQALDLFGAGGDRAGAVFVTQSLGLLQLARGEWDRALKSFVEALEESRQLGLKDASAVSLGNLGRVAHYQGRYSAALASYAEALTVLRELGDQRGLAEFTLFEAETMAELGMLEAMDQRLDEVEKMQSAGQSQEQRAELLNLQAESHLRQGNPAAARRLFSEALEAGSSSGVIVQLRARLGLGRAELAAGAPAAAQTLAEVDAAALRVGHAVLRLEAGESLARAELARGEPGRAEEVLRRTVRLAGDSGAYSGSYRLHALLARALSARGSAGPAATELALATEELARVKRQLTPAQRASFERLPEVTELVEQTASTADSAADAA